METPSHVDVNLSEEDLQKSTEKSDLMCKQCSRTFKNLNALRMHKVKTHNQISSDADFRLRHRHQNCEQEVERRYFCPVAACSHRKGCSYFTAFKLLKQHYMKVHGKKILSCEKCGVARFSLLRDLKYHQKHLCSQKEIGAGEPSAVTVPTFTRPDKTKLVEKISNSPRQRRTDATHLKKVFIITPLPFSKATRFIPILPAKSVRSVSSQTNSELSFVQGSLSKDVGTNVTAFDLHSHQNAPLPPINSISFQSERAFNKNDFYCQAGSSYDPQGTIESQPEIFSQSLNYTVEQNDCGVQSNLEYIPETRHVETHMDDFDFEEIWRHIETQTSEPFGNDALTQTVNDFMDCGIMTDGPYQPWGQT